MIFQGFLLRGIADVPLEDARQPLLIGLGVLLELVLGLGLFTTRRGLPLLFTFGLGLLFTTRRGVLELIFVCFLGLLEYYHFSLLVLEVGFRPLEAGFRLILALGV